jgi:hypothetical protein
MTTRGICSPSVLDRPESSATQDLVHNRLFSRLCISFKMTLNEFNFVKDG